MIQFMTANHSITNVLSPKSQYRIEATQCCKNVGPIGQSIIVYEYLTKYVGVRDQVSDKIYLQISNHKNN